GALLPAVPPGAGAALHLPAAPAGVADAVRAKRARRGERALAAFSLLAYLFLYAPILVLVAFSFNRGRLTAAWEGFTFAWYLKLLDDVQVLTSLRNSLLVAFAATLVCTVLGTAAALALHRHRFRRQAAVEAMVTLPIVVPEIVL